jgi:hypothetical protein
MLAGMMAGLSPTFAAGCVAGCEAGWVVAGLVAGVLGGGDGSGAGIRAVCPNDQADNDNRKPTKYKEMSRIGIPFPVPASVYVNYYPAGDRMSTEKPATRPEKRMPKGD